VNDPHTIALARASRRRGLGLAFSTTNARIPHIPQSLDPKQTWQSPWYSYPRAAQSAKILILCYSHQLGCKQTRRCGPALSCRSKVVFAINLPCERSVLFDGPEEKHLKTNRAARIPGQVNAN